jgi:hypothetical protein
MTAERQFLFVCGCARSGTTALALRSVGPPDRIRGARIVGDKQPRFFAVYDHRQAVFPSAKIVFIARDIFDVAASYKRRLLKPDNRRWTWDAARAAVDWNQAIANTLAVRCQAALHIVEYEKIFGTGEGIDGLADFIGVDPAPFHAALPKFLESSKTLAHVRAASLVLTLEERLHIARHADRRGYDRLLRRRQEPAASRPAGQTQA